MHWVIAYDIHDHRRRRRVAKAMERAGLRVQKSVFVADLSPHRLQKLLRELSWLIDPQTDQVAAWAMRQDQANKNPPSIGLVAVPQFQQVVIW